MFCIFLKEKKIIKRHKKKCIVFLIFVRVSAKEIIKNKFSWFSQIAKKMKKKKKKKLAFCCIAFHRKYDICMQVPNMKTITLLIHG